MNRLNVVRRGALALISIVAVAQEAARTVQYHSQDIVPIRAQGQIHNPHRGATDREDHGSRHWR